MHCILNVFPPHLVSKTLYSVCDTLLLGFEYVRIFLSGSVVVLAYIIQPNQQQQKRIFQEYDSENGNRDRKLTEEYKAKFDNNRKPWYRKRPQQIDTYT